MPYLVALVLAVTLAAPFGEARGEWADGGVEQAEVTVEAPSGAQVFLHAVDVDGNVERYAMVERAVGEHWTRIEVDRVVYVVFEHAGEGVLSDEVRLADLGLVPEPRLPDGSTVLVEEEPEVPVSSTQGAILIWLAAVGASVILGAVGGWVDGRIGHLGTRGSAGAD